MAIKLNCPHFLPASPAHNNGFIQTQN
jgi:hypothetical protein